MNCSVHELFLRFCSFHHQHKVLIHMSVLPFTKELSERYQLPARCEPSEELLSPRMTLKPVVIQIRKSRCDMTSKRRDHDGYHKNSRRRESTSTLRHKGTMSHTPLDHPTPGWNLSGISNSRLQLIMDALEAMGMSGHDHLTGNSTGTIAQQ